MLNVPGADDRSFQVVEWWRLRQSGGFSQSVSHQRESSQSELDRLEVAVADESSTLATSTLVLVCAGAWKCWAFSLPKKL